MAKDQSFAAKVAKASSTPSGNHCPDCGELSVPVKMVVAERSKSRNSWKFNQKFVRVCKCNETEVYG